MGASTQSRNENKQYAVLVVYANKTDKILDITTSSNIKCYEWSLKKRLTETKADYTPTNKALKFVKTKFDDVSNVRVVKLNELTELKQLVEPEKIEKVDDVVVETDVLNSVIEDADKTDTEPPKVLVKPFYCELTDRYFTTKSSLAKHIKKSKEYQKALSLTTN